MKLGMILVLLLVFLTVVLLQLLFTRKEAFQASAKTQLTSKNVKELLDQNVLKLISTYDEIKKDATSLKDPRLLYRQAYFSSFISSINDQYPQIEYLINSYDWNTVGPNAISLEDLKTYLESSFYKVGRTGAASSLTPATLNDVDLLSSSLAATTRIYGEKLRLIQGGSEIKTMLDTTSRKQLEGLANLKRGFPTDPTKVPLFKNDLYEYAKQMAANNFVNVPEYDTVVKSGKIPEPTMNNLPIPKPITQTITELISKGTTTATTPSTATASTTATTSTPTPVSTSTIVPGSKFSELIQALIAYGGLSNKSSKPTLSNNTTLSSNVSGSTEKPTMADSAASVEDIRKVVRDELSEQLKSVKTGPKDAVNEDISKRSTEPVKPETPSVQTNALAQGSWFQTAAQGCPYAQGQSQTQLDPSLQPIPYPIDMNDYIRKDSIPCWGCTLK
jgi:hypothetical protein